MHAGTPGFSGRPVFFFFNDTATTEIYTLSLHDALPISWKCLRNFWDGTRRHVWAMGEYPLHAFVNLEEMARYHGVLNSVGFGLCSLVGWSLLQRKSMPECQ